jgi:hypothetical protein
MHKNSQKSPYPLHNFCTRIRGEDTKNMRMTNSMKTNEKARIFVPDTMQDAYSYPRILSFKGGYARYGADTGSGFGGVKK